MMILILEICTGIFDLCIWYIDGVKYHTDIDTKSLYELENIFSEINPCIPDDCHMSHCYLKRES